MLITRDTSLLNSCKPYIIETFLLCINQKEIMIETLRERAVEELSMVEVEGDLNCNIRDGILITSLSNFTTTKL